MADSPKDKDKPKMINADRPELKPIEPLLLQPQNYETISDTIGSINIEKPQPPGWWLSAAGGFFFVCVLGLSITYLFVEGTGIWGINQPIGWGFAIINLVWWIGIGHAGTLISAILLLLRQDWRNALTDSPKP